MTKRQPHRNKAVFGNGIDNGAKMREYDGRRLSKGQLFDNQNDIWLTSNEAAEFLKISKSCLMNMCSNGQIPYYKLERRNRYRMSDLKDLLLKTKRGGY